jgi:hypothetical protein
MLLFLTEKKADFSQTEQVLEIHADKFILDLACLKY